MKHTLLAVSVVLAGCAGTSGVVKSPSSARAWEDYWMAQYQAELAHAPKVQPRAVGGGRTVLLFPGLTISKQMFQPMAERLRADGFNPVLYEDATLISTGVAPAARRLAMEVEAVVAQTGEEKIDVVAECVGGVTARYYLQLLGGDKRIAHLVTFVSPHHGSMPATVAASVTGWQAMEDIRRGSALLQSLDAKPVPAGVRFTSIYSCSDGYLYPRNTSVVKGAENVELCGRTVGHFDGFWDVDVYRRIVDALVEGSERGPHPSPGGTLSLTEGDPDQG